MRCRALLLLLPSALAFELPFKPKPRPIPRCVHTPDSRHWRGRSWLIGRFLDLQAQERFGLDVQVDVYEKSDYVGGRSTVVYPYGNASLPELELGGSIFVTANKNLWRASDEFGLGRRDFSDEDESTGIWDGQEMLLSFSGSWWDTAKLLWRYGFLSPRRTENFVRALVDKYLTLYNSDSPKWDSVADLSATFGWTEIVSKTALEHLRTEGVSDKYINEVVDAATRVNYGQDIDYIHALEGALSMAANGAVGIAGGKLPDIREIPQPLACQRLSQDTAYM
ncbi:hypothetical protein NLJ89_g12261 [Agrocybe chaxingu]|uniref:Prenylcysteine lyase domain-containing protein n=1 Tax=Agrocybe chaxingu TaxID=84603 RepID=A0A9W8JNL9_9AGAR|nr:hypothetical protein NLJ89_g12261 [Agrocybe chaxingu]